MSFFISTFSRAQLPLFLKLSSGFATKMQASSTSKTKDSAGRRLGVKKFGGEEVFPNDILIRQRGFKWKPGNNTVAGLDHTIHSKIEGKVRFDTKFRKKQKITTVHVEPAENPNRTIRHPIPYCYHPELFPERAQFNPDPIKYPRKPKERKPKVKTVYWFGQKQEKNPENYAIQVPEHYFSAGPPKSAPRPEFPIYPQLTS